MGNENHLKLLVGDKLYEEGIDFIFTKNREVIFKDSAMQKRRKWWQIFFGKKKAIPSFKGAGLCR